MALQPRPPVITIMGHVDHGKTTLLDYLRHSTVAAGEAGGITQHIGAYQVDYKGKKLTFIDTPGHAAFNKMRERGAKVTDIVILVVAANDGVKPQTIESIRHIKEAKVGVVVAINKIDLPDVRAEVAKSQLAENGIMIQEYGGDIEAVEISAKTGQNIDKLLETVALLAELNNYQADPEAPLEAVVIEATKDAQKGATASVIVRQGTLKIRQDIYTDDVDGRVRSLINDRGVQLHTALPGEPAEISGLKEVPEVGSTVRDMAAEYSEVLETEEVVKAEAPAMTQDESDAFATLNFSAAFSETEKIKLILKADVQGTLEAIEQTIDLDSVEIISSNVGPVNDQDISLAETTGAAIIAFHVKIPGRVKEKAKAARVPLRKYDVIYKLIEDLQKQMLKLLEPTIDEIVTGEAEILQLFEMRGDKIAGVRVKTGEIKKTDKFHLKREDTIITDVSIKSMQSNRLETDGIKAKNEGGVTFKQNKVKFQVGDVLVAFTIEDEE